MNPEVGKEFKYTFEPCEPKKVLIIGGGPGGMNAAIAAARRDAEDAGNEGFDAGYNA